MKHLPLNPQIFIDNRKRFAKEMKPNSIAIFNSNDEVPVNGDAIYRFQQNSDLYWLCGIEQEDTMVIFFPGNPDPRYREVLVLVRPNELKEKWDGKRLRSNEATAICGIETIVWLDSLDAVDLAAHMQSLTGRRIGDAARVELEVSPPTAQVIVDDRVVGRGSRGRDAPHRDCCNQAEPAPAVGPHAHIVPGRAWHAIGKDHGLPGFLPQAGVETDYGAPEIIAGDPA